MDTDRLYTMHLLQRLLVDRMGIAVIGDQIYWHDASQEARVETPRHGTWYAARFICENEWYTACGPVMVCPRCQTESVYKYDIADPEQYAIVVATGALCECNQSIISRFTPYCTLNVLAIAILCVSMIVSSVLISKSR